MRTAFLIVLSTTTYGHWVKGETPYILTVRFKLKELDALTGRE
jgi:hypothetical protein